jgi:nucleoside phosphorylase
MADHAAADPIDPIAPELQRLDAIGSTIFTVTAAVAASAAILAIPSSGAEQIFAAAIAFANGWAAYYAVPDVVPLPPTYSHPQYVRRRVRQVEGAKDVLLVSGISAVGFAVTLSFYSSSGAAAIWVGFGVVYLLAFGLTNRGLASLVVSNRSAARLSERPDDERRSPPTQPK